MGPFCLVWAAFAPVPYATALYDRAEETQCCCVLASERDVDSSTRDFYFILIDAAHEAGQPNRSRGSGPPRRFVAPFFDRECLQLRREFHRLAGRVGYNMEVKALERRYHSIVQL